MEEKQSAFSEAGRFSELYQQNYQKIYRYVYRVLLDRQTAEDIAQDTFYLALLKYDEFLDSPNPHSWLYRTARFKILEFYRKMQYRLMEPLEQDNPELMKEDVQFSMKELEVTALTTLGKEGWQLIKKYYLLGTSITELAKAEGVTENNMRVRLTRLKKRLWNGIEH